MKIRILFTVAFFIFGMGCEKQENVIPNDPSSPSAPVLSYFNSINAQDSAGVMNSFGSALRQKTLVNTDTMRGAGIGQLLKNVKGIHYDIKITDIKIDNTNPNMAKVYVSETVSGRISHTVNSIYYSVIKEDGIWKLASSSWEKDK
ncbi:MAG: hypothetical protein Q8916_14375 [Bacteroidota bacterium]|nr:hypothetical protein [Bacteroidota bacterium]MDP4231581.1 hypothetical protein [Bacteroidota bacterium]MDP4236736.1 hypothetical protein [Bacteroidota bacterium]